MNHAQQPSLGLTESLGIHGWQHLDALLLAALATESPLLLIGPHGTAKSLLIERMATALQLAMRHYNASLINYDDLVGIPLPEADLQSLRFVTTPGSIWDAEFVFFDEISRCRPDLQNKMFPIVHERRVAGIKLEKLRHRWAAMNPPAPEDPDTQSGDLYIGSEALDPALVDRFPFIIPVPAWKNLSKTDRRRMLVRLQNLETDAIDIEHMVNIVAELIPDIENELESWVMDYVITVVDLLEQAHLPQSPRRAYMLARTICAIHAARMILGNDLTGENTSLALSAEMAIQYGIPQTATEIPPNKGTLITIHKQAWEISTLAEDSNWRIILEEFDPVQRISLALELQMNNDDLSRLITQALGSSEFPQHRRAGLAAILFLKFRETHDLAPSTWEPMVKLALPLLHPRSRKEPLSNRGFNSPITQELRQLVQSLQDQRQRRAWLERNFLVEHIASWSQHDWRQALTEFRDDYNRFLSMETTHDS